MFRTPGSISEHRHGWFDRHAYMSLPPEQRAQPVEPGEVWDWDDEAGHWWSCSQTAT